MAYVDLGEANLDAAIHGFGAANLGDAFAHSAPFDQAVRDARERLGVPEDRVVLGLDDLGRYLGSVVLPNNPDS